MILAHEIFDKVRAASTTEERARVLSQYAHLRDIQFIAALVADPEMRSKIRIPEYKVSDKPATFDYMTIRSAVGHITAALRHPGNTALMDRKIALVLENVHAGEAELLVELIKHGRVEGIHKSVFKRAFPAFFLSGDSD